MNNQCQVQQYEGQDSAAEDNAEHSWVNGISFWCDYMTVIDAYDHAGPDLPMAG